MEGRRDESMAAGQPERTKKKCATASEETTMKSLHRVLALGTLLAISYSVLAADTADPVIGTWKLNAAKSQVRAGPALAKSDARTYTTSDGGVTLTWKRVTGE